MAFKPIDPKRDEFRRYLERAGVIEALTKIFVRLVKERPENPMEYLHNNLGDARLQADHEAFMRTELEEARAEIQRLRNIVIKLDPTALEETKEADLSDKIENEENSLQENVESNSNLERNSNEEDTSTASDKVAQHVTESGEKYADDKENVEIPAQLENEDKVTALLQTHNADGASDQMIDTVGAAAKQPDDNICEESSKLSD